ncbi:MAG: FAD-linked oxidase C-terminal domain-containing protein [Anaerolineaceae bacterium]|nr:FAD-linked oxidase C-terminal domain-containing protein [Anaerolineaceae bacterium]
MPQIQSIHPKSFPYESVKRVQGYAEIGAHYSIYLVDESKTDAGSVDWLFFPRNEAELAAVVDEMHTRKVTITVAGSRTGLVGGCVPAGGALISMEHFDQVLSIYYEDTAEEWRVRLQANVSLKALQDALKFKRFPFIESNPDPAQLEALQRFKAQTNTYYYPPDPTEMSASIGGTTATNASGARTFHYGPTRAWVRAIRVLLMNGEILEIPRGKYFASERGEFEIQDSQGQITSIKIPTYSMPATKNAAGFYSAPGMDLIDLFIGSEGVLGIITEVEVALVKQQGKLSMVQFLSSDEQAMQLTVALRSNPALSLDFLEFYSVNALALLRARQAEEYVQVGVPQIPASAGAALFFELSIDPRLGGVDLSALQSTLNSVGADANDSWVAYEARELERLKAFRHLLPETVNGIIAARKKEHNGLHKLGTDLSVPDEHLFDMWQLYQQECSASGLEWLAFGHIGNNHLHINILPRNEQEVDAGLELYARFARKAVEFGGSVSAEHGIGKLKRKFFALMFTEAQIEEMREVKRALDPFWLLNPGNLFEERDI